MTAKPTVVNNIARRVLMASWLYYRHNEAVVGDDEFDAMCKTLARRWIALSPFLQWQLGSAEEIAASGFHCKITLACAGGAQMWAKTKLGVDIPVATPWNWIWDEERNVRWIEAGAAL